MTTALVANATGNMGFYDYTTTGSWPTVWPTNYCYHTSVSVDEGKKAFKLAQALLEKKLVEPKSVKQFIDLVNTILTELKRA